jgi:hypothetical protein
MPDEDQGERQWIVEPPAQGEVSLYLAVGEGTTLTEEQEAAVGALLRTLEASEPEVAGHATKPKCPGQSSCTDLRCSGMSCGTLKCSNLAGLTAGRVAEPWNIMGSFGGAL